MEELTLSNWKDLTEEIWPKIQKDVDNDEVMFKICLTEVMFAYLDSENGAKAWIKDKPKYEEHRTAHRIILDIIKDIINKIHDQGQDPKAFDLVTLKGRN